MHFMSYALAPLVSQGGKVGYMAHKSNDQAVLFPRLYTTHFFIDKMELACFRVLKQQRANHICKAHHCFKKNKCFCKGKVLFSIGSHLHFFFS